MRPGKGRYLFLMTFVFLLALNSQSQKEEHQSGRPNIIFIIGDDISVDDIGCYGNSLVKTPNLDRLADEGVRFSNMFVTSSSCSPSRTSILTGRYPHNTGAAELHTPLPAHLSYFPEQLRSAGYYTALLGKWHEGKETARAYDTLIAGEGANGMGGEDQWINMLKDRPAGKPFFFWLAPFDAHREWSADTFSITHDAQTEVSVPLSLVDDSATRKDLASYYNEISRLDFYTGKLRDELERQGILKNTIIIFIADNARPFSNAKTRLLDRGVKTPFIFYWRNGMINRRLNNALISSIDLAPTLLQIAGIKPAPSIQGKSFYALLRSASDSFRNYIFSEHNWHDYEAYERAVRTKDYLYLYNGRPPLDNEGPIDVNQSPSAFSLKAQRTGNALTKLQSEIFIQPRPPEEFYVLATDSLQIHNEINNPLYKKEIAQLKNILAIWQKQTRDTEPEGLTPDWYDRITGRELPEKGIRGEMPGAAKQASHTNNKGPF